MRGASSGCPFACALANFAFSYRYYYTGNGTGQNVTADAFRWVGRARIQLKIKQPRWEDNGKVVGHVHTLKVKHCELQLLEAAAPESDNSSESF